MRLLVFDFGVYVSCVPKCAISKPVPACRCEVRFRLGRPGHGHGRMIMMQSEVTEKKKQQLRSSQGSAPGLQGFASESLVARATKHRPFSFTKIVESSKSFRVTFRCRRPKTTTGPHDLHPTFAHWRNAL
eukprot:571234-Rhodomonas_salina.1